MAQGEPRSLLDAYQGRVSLERLLERKPLHDVEQRAAPATVCVIGAGGFIGSKVTARLLAAGHTVHATRSPAGDDDGATMAVLRALPGAAERLLWFAADPMEDGSTDAALEGCTNVVLDPPPISPTGSSRHAYSSCIQPALRLVENVLHSNSRAVSVEKVVMTSFEAAVLGGHTGTTSAGMPHQQQPRVYSNTDFNTSVLDVDLEGAQLSHHTVKALAELEAWAIAGQQDRWRLITICPGTVVGPPLANQTSWLMGALGKLTYGSTYPFIAPLGMNVVDVDDVAAAHMLALVTPGAHGRFLLSERSILMTEAATMLRWRRTTSVQVSGQDWSPPPALKWSMREMVQRLQDLGELRRAPTPHSAAATVSASRVPGAVPLPHVAPATFPGAAAVREAVEEAPGQLAHAARAAKESLLPPAEEE